MQHDRTADVAHVGQSYADYLASDRWRQTRKRALIRAENRCQLCNQSKRLEVHHRTYERLGNERPMDLTVLCGRCHSIFHRLMPTLRENAPKRPRKLTSRQRRAKNTAAKERNT